MDIAEAKDSQAVPVEQFEYVDAAAVNEILKCSLCLEPFVDPFKTPCGHTFCRTCIQRCVGSQGPCPLCRKEVSIRQLQSDKNQIVLQLLDKIPIFCARKPRGCKWQGQRGNLSDHLRSCAFGFCQWRDEGCEWAGSVRELVAHLSTCDCAVVSCSFADHRCEFKGRRKSLDTHLATCGTAQRVKENAARRQARELEGARKQALEEEERRRADELDAAVRRLLGAQPIVLDVGGRLFKTSVQTLRKYPVSVLGAMFSSRNQLQKDANGLTTVFLDRSPAIFDHVLTFLRTGVVPELSGRERVLVGLEAEFWGLPALTSSLRGANLTNALLPANLIEADLTGVDLSGRDLTGANLTGADLTGANLTGANLTNAAAAKAEAEDAIAKAETAVVNSVVPVKPVHWRERMRIASDLSFLEKWKK